MQNFLYLASFYNMSKDFLIAIDQGTTGSRIFCFDTSGNVITSVYQEFTQHFPHPGWVEHDADEIWDGIVTLLEEAIEKGKLDPKNALGIGITNQRETTVIWDRKNGKPIHNAIVWQCRRTTDICKKVKDTGLESTVRKKTGLVIDAYFSGTKIQWLLENVNGIRKRAENGELAAGTIDSFLLYKLTGEHATEYTNASRTLIYNIEKKEWDNDLLEIFGKIPASLLPEVKPTRAQFGVTSGVKTLPDGIPVLSMVGDQQAAMFGQLCVNPGQAKNTYGTGCFLLFNTGDQFLISKSGLLTTLACDNTGNVCYALEGSVFIAGAVMQWLRDYMKFFSDASQTDNIISNLNDDDSVILVPAFVGLGAPHWDMNARGAIFGLTRDTSQAQIIRGALKSIALQSLDLVIAMETDTGKKMSGLRVDGGATANEFLMQYQANILNRPVERPSNIDTTAIGAAYLAGIEAGLWKDASELLKLQTDRMVFKPDMDEKTRSREIKYWRKAIERVKEWEE